MKKEVVIVGAGPSGLATAACLNAMSIPNVILEKEDCMASLWKRRAYDRLKLHLAKQFCSLPHMPHSASAPTFIPKDDFIRYLDDYADRFKLHAECCTNVESAVFVDEDRAWNVVARNTLTGTLHEYTARFLVVATGENAQGFIPDVPGMKSFAGEVMHVSEYKSGAPFRGKRVLVVGSGNSGMEIAYDLSNYGAITTIAIRSPLHVMTKEMIQLGMMLVKHLPVTMVDSLLVLVAKLMYGDMSKFGIIRPQDGPLAMKAATGRSAVIDVGTIAKIRSGEIGVVKAISSIRGSEVIFSCGKAYHFDAIIFATGYKSTANTWLKDENHLLNGEGLPKESFPNHWKGKNGLYCVGLSRRGLAGISMDAELVANDIKMARDRDA